MNKTKFILHGIISLAFIGLISGMAVTPVEAYKKVADHSAVLATANEHEVQDNRAEILKAYLRKYDSPLIDSADTFIEEADRNNLDWKLVVSIAGVESWFGHRIPPNSYNGWGWGVYGDNVIHFNSWDEGITVISKSLRVKYMDKWGAKNVTEIGRIYAADPAWAQKVTSFMNKIEAFESSFGQESLPISI